MANSIYTTQALALNLTSEIVQLGISAVIVCKNHANEPCMVLHNPWCSFPMLAINLRL